MLECYTLKHVVLPQSARSFGRGHEEGVLLPGLFFDLIQESAQSEYHRKTLLTSDIFFSGNKIVLCLKRDRHGIVAETSECRCEKR